MPMISKFYLGNKEFSAKSPVLEWSEGHYQTIYNEVVESIDSAYLLPDTTDEDQVIYGMVKVEDRYDNYVAFSVSATSAYQVDWGDGTVETVSSGYRAEHLYDFSNPNLNDHVTTLGFKTALVTVTPVGGNLISVDFQKYPSIYKSVTTSQGGATLWLSISVTGQWISLIQLSRNTSGSTVARMSNLVTFSSKKNAITNPSYLFKDLPALRLVYEIDLSSIYGASTMTYLFSSCYSLEVAPVLNFPSMMLSLDHLFYYCSSLRAVPMINTSGCTNLSSMFQYCYSLMAIPPLDTSSAKDMNSLFYDCFSLESIPPLDTSNATNPSSLLRGCASLKAVPFLDTSKATDLHSMFDGCAKLTAIPEIDTGMATNMSSLFSKCYSLRSIPQLNTSQVTNMSYMFNSCVSLISVPLLDSSNVTNMSSMFYGCYALTSFDWLNTHSVTNMSSMFYNCFSLGSIAPFDTAAVTNMYAMFYSCSALESIPPLDTSAVTNMTNMLFGCYSLKRIQAPIKYSMNLTGFKLSPDSLNEIYTNLPETSGQTLTISGNYGTNADDPTIATVKGWTVVG